jgi:hypothetical protein
MGDDGFGSRVGELIEKRGGCVVYSHTLTPTLLLHVKPTMAIHVVDAAYAQEADCTLSSPLRACSFAEFTAHAKLLLSFAPICTLWSAQLLNFEIKEALSVEAELFALQVADAILTETDLQNH